MSKNLEFWEECWWITNKRMALLAVQIASLTVHRKPSLPLSSKRRNKIVWHLHQRWWRRRLKQRAALRREYNALQKRKEYIEERCQPKSALDRVLAAKSLI